MYGHEEAPVAKSNEAALSYLLARRRGDTPERREPVAKLALRALALLIPGHDLGAALGIGNDAHPRRTALTRDVLRSARWYRPKVPQAQ